VGICCRSEVTPWTAGFVRSRHTTFVHPARRNDTVWSVSGMTALMFKDSEGCQPASSAAGSVMLLGGPHDPPTALTSKRSSRHER